MDIMSVLAENFDLPILDWIAGNLRSSALDILIPIISLAAEYGILFMLLSAIFLCVPKTRRVGVYTAIALALGTILCNVILKPIVHRPRPGDYQLEHFGIVIDLLVKRPTDFSFPSGHTIAAFEFAIAAMYANKKIGIPFLVLAFLVGFARMYLYVHYPTDVIAAGVLGVLMGCTGAYLGEKIIEGLNKKGKHQA